VYRPAAGSRTVDGAVNAAIGLVVFNWLLGDALRLEPGIVLILFGLGALTYARHPEGIIEAQGSVAVGRIVDFVNRHRRTPIDPGAEAPPDVPSPVDLVV